MSQRARSLLDWLKIYALPISVVLLGLFISLGLFYWLRGSEDRQVRRRFDALASSRVENLESKLSAYSSILELVTDFYGATDSVDRSDFQSLTGDLLDRHEEISTIQWLPSVPDAERSSYRTNLVDEGFRDPKIIPITSGGDTASSLSRDRWFPVTYVEPTFPGQESKYIGIDYLTSRNRNAFLRKMTEKNIISVLISVEPLRTLVGQTDVDGQAFVLLKPVFEGEHMMVKKRWRNLAGIIALEVSHDHLMKTVFPPEESESFNLYVYAEKRSGRNRLLFTDRENQSQPSTSEVQNWWTYEREVPIGDRSLHLLLNPSDSYRAQHRTVYPWIVLFVGLGLTALLGRGSYRLSGEYLSQEKQFYSIFDSAPYAIATLDERGAIRLWNRSARTMFGYSTNEASGMNVVELLDEPENEVEQLLQIGETEDEEQFHELQALRRSGETFPVNLGIRGWTLQGRQFYTLMAEDITERKKYQKRIEQMARRDDLTGLLNRATFMQRLAEEYERIERYDGNLSVVMVDVDHFKKINDTHGHLAGDDILKGLARTLEENTRQPDFCGRYGGEEFCVALPKTDAEKAEEMTERLRTIIQETEYVEGVSTTCSFGVAEYEKDVEDLDDLMARADEALYRSKEQGRNQVSVY